MVDLWPSRQQNTYSTPLKLVTAPPNNAPKHLTPFVVQLIIHLLPHPLFHSLIQLKLDFESRGRTWTILNAYCHLIKVHFLKQTPQVSKDTLPSQNRWILNLKLYKSINSRILPCPILTFPTVSWTKQLIKSTNFLWYFKSTQLSYIVTVLMVKTLQQPHNPHHG